jgi:gas vesicle protein
MKKLIIAFAFLFTVSTVFTGCREEKKAGEQIEETVDEVGDGIEDAADDVGDEVEDAADDVEDAVDDATDG